MSFTWHPHKIVMDAQYGVPVVKHEADFVMLSNAGQRAYVQRGEVYVGDLENPCAKHQLPSWFWDAYKNLTPEARNACGLQLPEDEAAQSRRKLAEIEEQLRTLPDEVLNKLLASRMPLEAPRMPVEAIEISSEYVGKGGDPTSVVDDPRASRPKTWTCPECTDEVETIRKGVHIGMHRRQAKAEARRLSEVQYG